MSELIVRLRGGRAGMKTLRAARGCVAALGVEVLRAIGFASVMCGLFLCCAFPRPLMAQDPNERVAALTALSASTSQADATQVAQQQDQAKPTAEQAAQAKTMTDQERVEAWRVATQVERENWRQSILKTRRPKKGCFVASYPETQWREVQCVSAPKIPYPRKKGPRPDTVGSGTDYSAVVTGDISIAEGSFDSVSSGISETGGGAANSFSLQLNTEYPMTTTACGTVSGCGGWEQFIYSNSNCENLYPALHSKACVFIQSWLVGYGASCPSSAWTPDGFGDCYINSTNATPVPTPPNPAPTVAELADMQLRGEVAGVSGTDDEVTLTLSGTAYTATGDDRIPDLDKHWQVAEFNVFGDGGGSQADFGANTTLVVRTQVDSGMNVAPTCTEEGYTGETNNLTLITAPAPSKAQYPSVIFTESNANNPAPNSCATSQGDTHLRTFDGLYYDFQSSGEFTLVDAGPDFRVQARQASGAPLWPNAAVNKAIAVQMGKTRIAIYIEPTRLIVNGKATNLAEGKTIMVDGVQISHWRNNEYTFVSPASDVVHTQLNSIWINVSVGLAPERHGVARGLLGNPNGNSQELAAADGNIFREPISFDDIYHAYGESWRVQAKDSLFTVATTIKAGIPDKPFYAEQLDPQEQARVRAVCTAAGVTNEALLGACMLDTAVLGTDKAARVFVNTAPPVHLIKPVLRVTTPLTK